MPINELKILSSDYLGYQIGELSDKPALDGLSAQQLKDRFDALTKEVIVPGFNALVDALLDTSLTDSGAQNVGSAAIDGVSGGTVHAQLQSLKTLIDGLVVASVENVPAGSITDEKLSDSGADIKERFAAFANGHNHVLADVTDAAAALDGKAAAVHAHAMGDVSGLQASLDGKSPTTHTHAGVYQPAGSYAAASHAQAISTISGLQTALDAKANTSHSQSISTITGLDNTTLFPLGIRVVGSYGPDAARVPNVIYSTNSTPPADPTIPDGTIFVQYTP